MRRIFLTFIFLLFVAGLSVFYYSYEFSGEVDRIFLSISTFLFSIFAGFFISRQAGRFNRVRESVTKFDGLLSSFYRTSGHVSAELQAEAGEIIREHYETILQSQQWTIHFLQPSRTISALHELLDEHVEEKQVTKLSNQAIGSMVKGLGALQGVRKQMLALYKERIPFEQWGLIIFFAIMLIGTVSASSSVDLVFFSILKAAFVVSILAILYILYRLNELKFTERIMGEESAQDVISIIDGTR